jgi:UDP-2,4-diacetamido-2,4,6-trideoxy-beta-L-altropyranose hydrolase
MNTVIIRADASSTVGAGHQMRCLALAQAIGELGGRAVFAAAHSLDLVERRLAEEGIRRIVIQAPPGSIADATAIAAIANELEAEWIVADGYCFDAAFQRHIKTAGLNLLSIDDVASCEHYYSDIIVNPNISAHGLDYSAREPETKLCLGTRYALLRQDFLRTSRDEQPGPADARHILVTLGGGETSAAIETVVEALLQSAIPEMRVVILLNAAHPLLPSLRQQTETLPGAFEFVTDSTRIADHMRWAHMAISAAGGTSWELAYFGVPTLLVVVAENQQPSAEELAARKAVVNLGWGNELTVPDTVHALTALCRDLSRRELMAEELRRLIDGRGARRVAAQLLNTDLQKTGLQETA